MKYYGDIELVNGKIINFKIDPRETLPESVSDDEGKLIYNLQNKQLYYSTGEEFLPLQVASEDSEPLITSLGREWLNPDYSFNPTPFNNLTFVSGLASTDSLLTVIQKIDQALVEIDDIDLNDINGVNVENPSAGDVLYFDGENWKNVPIGEFGGGGNVPDLSQITLITANDETTIAPNSRRIVPGANIEIDVNTQGQLIISATSISIPPIPPDLSNLTFLTINPEASLPHSRHIAAGTNISFDVNTDGVLYISAAGGGGGSNAPDLSGLTFITVGDETAQADNSKKLVPGTNVTFDTTTNPNEIGINVDISSLPPDLSDLSFLTFDIELGAPDSKRIMPGTNVSFDSSVPGELRINASPGGGVANPEEVITTVNAASVIRSTVSAAKWPGVTSGTGLDINARTQNRVALQESIDYAVANRMIWELDYGNYEIAGGPLIVNGSSTGAIFRAPLTATIFQATDNVSILQLSGVAGSGTSTFGLDWYGTTLHYLNNQAGNTGANALVLGNLWRSTISDIRIANNLTSARPYRGVYISGAEFFFSNIVKNIGSFQAHYSAFEIASIGTGNSFENIYLNGRSNSQVQQSCTYPFRWQHPGFQMMHDSVFNQLNIEWFIALSMMTIANVRGATFNSLHVEQNRFTGAHPSAISTNISNLTINGMMMLDNLIQSSIASGNPSIFRSSSESATAVSNLVMVNNYPASINIPFYVAWQGNDLDNTPAYVNIRNLRLIDGSGTSIKDNCKLDRSIDSTTFGYQRCTTAAELSVQPGLATVNAARMDLLGSTSIYGAMANNAFVTYPATLTADSTLRLMSTMGPAATRGSGVPVKEGTIMGVRRRDGTVGNTLTIVNDINDSVLVTNTTSAISYWFKFSGGNWSLIV